MHSLNIFGFEKYLESLGIYLQKYKDLGKGEKSDPPISTPAENPVKTEEND